MLAVFGSYAVVAHGWRYGLINLLWDQFAYNQIRSPISIKNLHEISESLSDSWDWELAVETGLTENDPTLKITENDYLSTETFCIDLMKNIFNKHFRVVPGSKSSNLPKS